ncbi:cell adhesion molecule Dscam1-like isoform X4 [Tachypleus tridentatus]|uniref:cell adhesion molecule Dscam1-like isoform X4 n=1 Tax=Tachypleus tridentatus TaxID=6853 RepID=UPI003FD64B73
MAAVEQWPATNFLLLLYLCLVISLESPRIQPFSFLQKAELGTHVRVTCGLLKGTLPVTFIWKKNGKILQMVNDKVRLLPQEGFVVLEVKNVDANDNGNYTCIAKNAAGSDSFTSLLTVEDPPTIQPFSFPPNVELGSQGRLTCGLQKGTLPVHFLWKKNDKEISSSRDSIQLIQHESFLVLEIRKITVSDIANYTCIAQNPAGVDRYVTQLLVKAPPRIQPFSFPVTVQLGKQINLYCGLSEGTPPLRFYWMKNGKGIGEENQNIQFIKHERSSILEIKSLVASDMGNYTCVVNNLDGEDTFTSELLVEAPPFWKEQPKDTEAVLGQSASLQCGVGGYPRPKITWKKAYGSQSKDFLIIHNEYKKTILENGTLVIDSLKEADEGVYTCEAANGVGDSIQTTVRLSVHAPPTVTSVKRRTSAKRGETAVIECEITGEQPLLVSWEKDGTKLTMPFTRFETYEEASGKGVKATLLISNVQRRDQGNYLCNVQNDYGSVKDVTALTVQEPPESPSDVKVISVNSRSAQVMWGAPSGISTSIKQYVMMFWKKSKVSGKLHQVSLLSSETSTLLRDLQPGNEYTVQILAENDVGRGDPSDPVTFETKEEEPEAPPVDVEVEALDSHTLQISWKPPPTDTWNGQLKGYHVGYKVEGSTSQLAYETVIKTNLREEKTLLRNLRPSTRYSVAVNAFNSAGDGPSSEELVTSTLNGDPPQSPEVKVKNVSQTSVTIMWSPRVESDASVEQYVLEYVDTDQNKNEFHAPGTRKEYCIEGLESGQRYSIRVAAYNMFGRGDFSPSLVVITEGNARVPGYEPIVHETPFYFRLYFVIPVVASITVILCVIVVAWACLKRAHYIEGRKAQLYVSYQQRLTYVPPSEISRDSRAVDAAYDIPWDVPNGGGSMGRDRSSYVKLKQGQNCV